jgi:ribonuclease-3
MPFSTSWSAGGAFERFRRPRPAVVCGAPGQGRDPGRLARGFDLGEYLRLGSGESRAAVSVASRSADALGADRCDLPRRRHGDCAERVLAWLAGEFEGLTLVDTNKDPKTRLQEFLQSRACELPRYEVVDIQGEPHCRTFFVECEVVLLNEKAGQGEPAYCRTGSRRAALIALGVENGND